jgi:hypothetical protein
MSKNQKLDPFLALLKKTKNTFITDIPLKGDVIKYKINEFVNETTIYKDYVLIENPINNQIISVEFSSINYSKNNQVFNHKIRIDLGYTVIKGNIILYIGMPKTAEFFNLKYKKIPVKIKNNTHKQIIEIFNNVCYKTEQVNGLVSFYDRDMQKLFSISPENQFYKFLF